MRTRLPLVLAAAALFGGMPALAENARLAAAQRLYQRAELEAALAELKAAEDSTRDENDLVMIMIYKGLIFAETGQGAQMGEMFKRAIAMRPWADVPQDTSPRLTKMFHEARREVWGSPGIKPWPKKAGGTKPVEAPEVKTIAPAEPPKTDAPKAEEAPKADAPKEEAKPAEEPKADAPKEEAKPAEEPKSDAPKADEPAKEAPKADDAPPDVPPSQ